MAVYQTEMPLQYRQRCLCSTAESIPLGASFDYASHAVQATLRAEDTSLVRDLRQQLNKQKQELHDARAEVLHLRTQALQKGTATPPAVVHDAAVQTTATSQGAQVDVYQHA